MSVSGDRDVPGAPVRRPRRAEEIFTAALQRLGEVGYERLTIESVAARSGVNKTTIYRWWPSKEALLADALLESGLLTFEMPDTGSLRGDLVALGERVAGLLAGDGSVPIAVAVLAAAPCRQELARAGASFFADRLDRERPIFRRAVQRGELPADADEKLIMDLLDGALWFRMILRGEPLPEGFVAAAVDAILAGVATG